MTKKTQHKYKTTINVKDIYMKYFPHKKRFGDSRDTRYPLYYVKKSEESNHEYALNSDEYAEIVTTYFKTVAEHIIETGAEFFVPYNVFKASVKRKQFKKSFIPKEPLNEVAFIDIRIGKRIFCRQAYGKQIPPKARKMLRSHIEKKRNNLYKYIEIA